MPTRETVPHSQRPEWAGFVPLVTDADSVDNVVSIDYRPAHLEAIAYFRAVRAAGEKSERALALTADMIGFNHADYTVWQYRWECLVELGADLQAEYKFTEVIMGENGKNYQLWNHRRKVVSRLGPAVGLLELAFAAASLELDEKNYHAWAHRQAIVAMFDLWDQELVFVEDMIHRDVRNNSAWAQRSLLLRHAASAAAAASTLTHTTAAPHSTAPLHPATRSSAKAPAEPSAGIASLSMEVTVEGPGTSQGTPPDEQLSPAAAARGSPSAADADMSDSPEPFSVTAARGGWPALLDRELQYLAVKIRLAPHNESCWNYLSGLYCLPGALPHSLGADDRVWTICCGALEDCPSCPPALDTLARFYLHAAAEQRTGCEQLGAGLTSAPAASSPVPPSQDGLAGDTVPSSTASQAEVGGTADAAEHAAGPEAMGLKLAEDEVQLSVQSGLHLLDLLKVADPVRSMYWAHRRHELLRLLPHSTSQAA